MCDVRRSAWVACYRDEWHGVRVRVLKGRCWNVVCNMMDADVERETQKEGGDKYIMKATITQWNNNTKSQSDAFIVLQVREIDNGK